MVVAASGFAVARDVVWVEVRNRDLGPSVDPLAFLAARRAEAGLPDALAFMTSRDISRHHRAERTVEGIVATCVTTVGLANAERVGAARSAPLMRERSTHWSMSRCR